jgi:hypothetical protein
MELSKSHNLSRLRYRKTTSSLALRKHLKIGFIAEDDELRVLFFPTLHLIRHRSKETITALSWKPDPSGRKPRLCRWQIEYLNGPKVTRLSHIGQILVYSCRLLLSKIQHLPNAVLNV